MKKRIIAIILSILVVLGIITIIFIKQVKQKFIVLYYENELKKYYNLEKVMCVSDFSIDQIDYYLSQPITEYDITKFVNFYYEQITNKNGSKIDNLFDGAIGITMHGMDLSDFVDKENVNLNEVAKELEKIFIHKSDDIYKEWYMPVEIPSNIETKETNYGLEVDMPLGYYYIYEKSDYKKLDDIKSVVKFKFIEDIDFDKSGDYGFQIIFELSDGTKKCVEDEVWYDQKYKKFSPELNKIYYIGENRLADITLGNHDLHDAYDGFWDNLDSY